MSQRTEAQIIGEIQHEGHAVTTSEVCQECETVKNTIYNEMHAGHFCFTKRGGVYVTSRAELERWKRERWHRDVKNRPQNHVNSHVEAILSLHKQGKGPLSIAVKIGCEARDVIQILIDNGKIRRGLYAHRSAWRDGAEDAAIDF